MDKTFFDRTLRLLVEGKLPAHCCSHRETPNGPTLQEMAQEYPRLRKKAKRRFWGILLPIVALAFWLGTAVSTPPSDASKAEAVLVVVTQGTLMAIMVGMMAAIIAGSIAVDITAKHWTALGVASDVLERTLKVLGLTPEEFENTPFAEVARLGAAALTARALAIVRLEKDPESRLVQAKVDQVGNLRGEFGGLYNDLARLGFVEGGYGEYFATAEATYAEESD